MNTMNCLTLALRNKNAMDVTKELVCINFCFGNNWFCYIQLLRIQIRQLSDSKRVSKCKHDYYRHSMLCRPIFILYYKKFKFQNGQTTEIRREYYSWYHMAHAEPDTSNKPSSKHRRGGRLKDTPRQHGMGLYRAYTQTHKSVPIMGVHIIPLKLYSDGLNVSRRCFERLVSDWWWWHWRLRVSASYRSYVSFTTVVRSIVNCHLTLE